MAVYTDQTERNLELAHRPKRIISTVPSQTELLYDLGLEKEVIGITAFCVHPKSWLQEKVVIGGTKDLKTKLIRDLKPDLIIGNKEENVKEQVEELAVDIPFWLSDVETFEDALAMISQVGELTGKAVNAEKLSQQILQKKEELKPLPEIPTAYFIWKEPYMLAGHSTFIGDMMQLSGLKNIAPQNEERYPQIAFEHLQSLQPSLILLSSEPFAFSTADAHQLAKICPEATIKIIDGERFSWYGSRMLGTIDYLKRFTNELSLIFQ